jgi:hypothetical protein
MRIDLKTEYSLFKVKSDYENLWQDPLKTKIFSSLPVNSIIVDGGCRNGGWIHAANCCLGLILNRCKSDFIYVGVDPIETPSSCKYDFFIKGALSKHNNNQVPFFVVENELGCSSLKEPSHTLQESTYLYKKRKVSKIEKIKTYRLDKIYKKVIEEGGGIPAYLKLDIQGAELEAIEGAGDFLKDIMFIETEIGLDDYNKMYTNSPKIEEIISVLDEKGFEPILFTEYSDSPLPEGEIIFKNKNYNIE